MRIPKHISIAGVIAMGIIIAACEKPYHQPEERYVLVTANVNLPYWQEAQEKMIAGLGEGLWQELRSSLRLSIDVAREADEHKPAASGAPG